MPKRASIAFKVRGLDCAEEVAVLKQAVGPLVGGADRLAFDILNGRMTVADGAREVTQEEIVQRCFRDRDECHSVDTPCESR